MTLFLEKSGAAQLNFGLGAQMPAEGQSAY